MNSNSPSKKANIRFGVSRIPDLNFDLTGLAVLLKVDVDGKVCVDVAHLVLEALGDTNDQVVNDGADSPEGSDTLAGTVVHLDRDHILLGAAEGDGNVREVLNELAWRRERKNVSVGRLRHSSSWCTTVTGDANIEDWVLAYLGVPRRSQFANECEGSL